MTVIPEMKLHAINRFKNTKCYSEKNLNTAGVCDLNYLPQSQCFWCSHQKRKESALYSLQAFKIYTFSVTVVIKVKITVEMNGRKSKVKMLRSFSNVKILHNDVEVFFFIIIIEKLKMFK